ncbi:MAG: hypothetical protein HONBIEJF_02178 [Fimbriimonadaceae bacterium]|nr:hypothetical protein [Fimbriimonadaceae bacterium]
MRYFSTSLILLALSATGALAQTTIFHNDFESGVATGFTNGPVMDAPNGSTKVLGKFGSSDGSTLELNGLASHTTVTLTLDLFVINSWDGNDGGHGPDHLRFSADGADLLHATFSNWSPSQSYSDATPLGGGPFAGKTDSDGEGLLGFGDFYGRDTLYRLQFTFAHSSSSLQVKFYGEGLQHKDDESWALDNVHLEADVVPEPATLTAMAVGLVAMRRRRARR